MRQIDKIHLLYPFYGSRNIRNELWARGYDVGRDRGTSSDASDGC